MALTTRRDPAQVGDVRGAIVEERITDDPGERNLAARAFGALAAAVPIAWSAAALIRLDWDSGLDAVPVTVAGLSFTPAVGVATMLLGLIAMAAAVSDDRASKLGIGALLSCIGIAVLLAGTARTDLDLQAGHGWLSLAVGLALVLAGIVMRADRLEVRSVGVRGVAH
jgi:hypothetical protein